MSFGIKIFGPGGREVYNSNNTAAMQMAASWFGQANGGLQNFPQFAGRQLFVATVATAPETTYGALIVYINYSNGWPQVTWGWSYGNLQSTVRYAFYAFTK